MLHSAILQKKFLCAVKVQLPDVRPGGKVLDRKMWYRFDCAFEETMLFVEKGNLFETSIYN